MIKYLPFVISYLVSFLLFGSLLRGGGFEVLFAIQLGLIIFIGTTILLIYELVTQPNKVESDEPENNLSVFKKRINPRVILIVSFITCATVLIYGYITCMQTLFKIGIIISEIMIGYYGFNMMKDGKTESNVLISGNNDTPRNKDLSSIFSILVVIIPLITIYIESPLNPFYTNLSGLIMGTSELCAYSLDHVFFKDLY